MATKGTVVSSDVDQLDSGKNRWDCKLGVHRNYGTKDAICFRRNIAYMCKYSTDSAYASPCSPGACSAQCTVWHSYFMTGISGTENSGKFLLFPVRDQSDKESWDTQDQLLFFSRHLQKLRGVASYGFCPKS